MYYTKYRPQKFSEVSKPNAVAVALMNQIKTGKTAHAYLFVGSRGTGKTTTARILAKALNCTNLDETGDPCDKCDSCVAIRNGNFLDLIEIDAASNRGIDDIRDLRDKVKLAPSSAKRKVYIIDEVHMLTNEAFNALLKTLEEPPSHCVFIFCTTELHKVPDTIKSRCQVFNFKRATVTQLVERLKAIIKAEKAEVSEEDLKAIAKYAQGGFRDAETLLQQVVEGNLDVRSLLVAGSKQDFVQFLDFILEGDVSAAFAQIDSIYKDGIDLAVWTEQFLEYLRDILFVKSSVSESLIDVPGDVLEAMTRQAEDLNFECITHLIEAFVEAHNALKASPIPQLPLELAVAKVITSQEDTSSELPIKEPEAPKKPKEPKAKEPEESKPVKVTVKKAVADTPTPSSDKPLLQLEEVTGKWKEVLKNAIKHNNSVVALLKMAEPIDIEGNLVVLEVGYSFHKERLESPSNKKIVEVVFSEIFGRPLSLKCKLGDKKPAKKNAKVSGELTDYNVAPVGPEGQSSFVDIFDGSLPDMGV